MQRSVMDGKPEMCDLFGRLPWKPCLVCGGFLATLAVFLLAWAFSTFPGDETALRGFQGIHPGWLKTAALTATSLGGAKVAAVLMALVAVSMYLLRRRVDSLIVLLSAIPMIAGFFLKEVVGRARPEYFLMGSGPSTPSFPSGHSLFAMVFGGLLIFLVEDLVHSAPVRRALQFSLVLLILAVGASRVYLGVHWPSDVLGGYLFGAMALLVLMWLRNRLAGRQRQTAVIAA
jgi:undecaprenyl-diphosphatase